MIMVTGTDTWSLTWVLFNIHVEIPFCIIKTLRVLFLPTVPECVGLNLHIPVHTGLLGVFTPAFHRDVVSHPQANHSS
jgi:hypothetical protein